MAIDFPASPSINDTFNAGGVTYTWDGTVWVASGSAAFVQKSGDDMSGDLTLGTDKITLNAADGSAEFAGGVSCGEYDGNNSELGVLSYSTGYVFINSNASDGASIILGQQNGNTKFSLNGDGTGEFAGGDISLNADGSATFASSVGSSEGFNGLGSGFSTFHSVQNNSTVAYAVRDNSGSVFYNVTTTDGSVFIGNASGTGTNFGSQSNISLNADGSSRFYGDMRINRRLDSSFNNVSLAIDNADAQGVIQLNNNGSATFAGQINGTTVGTSDARFKENITPANPQLDDVVALGSLLKNFDWNGDAPVNEEIRATRQLGLIAQEAEAVCPSLVKTVSRTKQGDELTPAEVDEDGNVIVEATYEELDDSYKGISHDALVMKLLGAVAELKAELEELKNAQSAP